MHSPISNLLPILLLLTPAFSLPAPEAAAPAAQLGSIYPPLGADYTATIPSPLSPTDPSKAQSFLLRYRAQSADESHHLLPPTSILACATAFRARIAAYVASGRAWDSPLAPTMHSDERDISSHGVYISIKPAILRFLPVTLEAADGLLQTVMKAAVDTGGAAGGTGFVEESYIDSFTKFGEEGDFIALAPMRLASGNADGSAVVDTVGWVDPVPAEGVSATGALVAAPTGGITLPVAASQ